MRIPSRRLLTAAGVICASAIAWLAQSSTAQQPRTLGGIRPAPNAPQSRALLRKRGFATASQIKHVVVIVMENRTPDNLFAGYYGSPYGNTGLTWGKGVGPEIASPNATPTLLPVALEAPGDPDHSHLNGFNTEYDDGLNDGWTAENVACKPKCTTTALSYVPPSETAIYAQLAENFSFGDHVFQANEGPSFIAHQYLISGQSGGIGTGALEPPFAEAENTIKAPAMGPDDVYPSPGPTWLDPELSQSRTPDFCQKGTTKEVRTIDMTQYYAPQIVNELSNPINVPCQDYTTILDEMAQRVPTQPWEYHWAGLAIWAAPMAVKHLSTSPNFITDPGGAQFVSEAKAGTLPALTYVIPCTQDSDHANLTKSTGPLWVATMLNAVGNDSALWKNTAVFITWDDWGGWYDHVPTFNRGIGGTPNVYPNKNGPPPNPRDPNEWGFRVPLLLVSPYARVGYVSKTKRSFTSILKFVEWNYGLQQLGTDDTYVDDLTDMFDFSKMSTPTWQNIPVSTNYTPCS